jgi:hypothetical protein
MGRRNMPDIVELFKVGVPAVIIPLAVFGANWAYRHHSEYNQTAASDFIMAVLIFDGTVVSAAKEFEPFIQHPELRLMAANWHITVAVLGGILWWLIVTFAEPVVAAHYSTRRNRPPFPFRTLLNCWVGVFILISVHVSFFVLR